MSANLSKFNKVLSTSLLCIFTVTSVFPANAAVKAGGTCKTLNSTSIVAGTKYTCVKSGKTLKWDAGKPVKVEQVIDYSTCLEVGSYTLNDLKQASYSNVAANYGQGQVYGTQLVNTISTKFGFGDLTFSNNSACKVTVSISGSLTCYAPLTGSSSQARSISISAGGGSSSFEVAGKSSKTVNVKSIFSYQSRSCELTSFQKLAGGSAASYGVPYISFGNDVSKLSVQVTGADPAAAANAIRQANDAAKQDLSVGKVNCIPTAKCPLGSNGPGGGIIFYDAGKQMSWGRYLEVAPAGWSKAPADPSTTWCGSYPEVSPSFESQFLDPAIQKTMGSQIGKGRANTLFMSANCVTTFEGAATLSLQYNGGGKTDWFLPSSEELNELCKFAQSQPSGSPSTPCGNSGKLRPGLILKASTWYLSSTEVVSTETPPAGTIWSNSMRFLNVNGRNSQVMETGKVLSMTNRFSISYRPIRYVG